MHSDQRPALTAVSQDAEVDVNKFLWFFIGFFGNIVGILIAYAYKPLPPASRLLGKSPEYAAFYTDSYKTRLGRLQGRWAVIGLITAVALGFMIFILIASGLIYIVNVAFK